MSYPLFYYSHNFQRWFFSNHFSQVDAWGVNSDGAITEHLKASTVLYIGKSCDLPSSKVILFAISDLLILFLFRRKKVVLKFTGNAQAVRHAPSWAVFLCKVRRAGQNRNTHTREGVSFWNFESNLL
jgi:hypothetical protein